MCDAHQALLHDPLPPPDDLRVTWTTRHHDQKGQAEEMVKLRALTDAGELERRDEVIYGVGCALCDEDVPRAARTTVEHIKQIRVSLFTAERWRIQAAAEDLVRRHSPPELLPIASR
jgi:hypothetical protein